MALLLSSQKNIRKLNPEPDTANQFSKNGLKWRFLGYLNISYNSLLYLSLYETGYNKVLILFSKIEFFCKTDFNFRKIKSLYSFDLFNTYGYKRNNDSEENEKKACHFRKIYYILICQGNIGSYIEMRNFLFFQCKN